VQRENMQKTDRKTGVESLPSTEAIRSELNRVRRRRAFGSTLRSTIFTLVTVAAAAVLVAVLLLPVLQIYGQSMQGTLNNGDIVVCIKGGEFRTGDVVAFYYNNKILVKRVIAGEGDWVDMDQDGTVYVNNEKLEEPYLTDGTDYGDTNITFPYQVPEGKIFVMGDNRDVSIDSRNTAVGCVSDEQVVGRIVFRVWPFRKIGVIH
jgi:signal peptidase I